MLSAWCFSEPETAGGLPGRHQDLFDVGADALAIDRAVEDPRCGQPRDPQRGEKRAGLPAPAGGVVVDARAARCPAHHCERNRPEHPEGQQLVGRYGRDRLPVDRCQAPKHFRRGSRREPVGGELLLSPQSVEIIKFGDPGSGR